MRILEGFGRFSNWFSRARANSDFLVTRTPLFKQLLDICFLHFPDALDVQALSYSTIPIYFLTGFMDYGLISILLALYQQLSFLWVSEHEAQMRSLNPDPWLVRSFLLLTFVLRAKSLGYHNIRRTCNFEALPWNEMWKLNFILLTLCPALYWHCLFHTAIAVLGLNQDRPWLSVLFHFLLSADWGTANLHSGWFISESRGPKKVNEKPKSADTENFWKKLVIQSLCAAFLQILVEMLPRLVLIIIVLLQHGSQAIGKQIAKTITQLRAMKAVKFYLQLEHDVIQQRDFAVARLIHMLLDGDLKGGARLQKSTRIKTVARIATFIHFTCLPILRFGQSLGDWIYEKFQNYYYPSALQTIANVSFEPRRFRLLELESSLFDEDEVTCNLQWYDLDNAPKYIAISYVWSSQNYDSPITLNGRVYYTTTSAKAAIKGLRSHWKSQRVWIDAICIDQDDVEDKARQISTMADIYRNAQSVAIWLGSDHDGALALSLSRRLFLRTQLQSLNIDIQYASDAPEQAWSGLRRVLQNPWFERSWVVQETFSRNVLLRCGSASLSWNSFSMFMMAIGNETEIKRRLHSLPPSHNQDHYLAPKVGFIRIFEEFRTIASHFEESTHLPILFYLVRMFRLSSKFKATETKDRVYALVNLCGLANHPKFKADYRSFDDKELTKSDLFAEVAVHLLTSGPEEQRLSFLAHAGIGYGPNTDYDMPSWIPDWAIETYPCLPFMGQDGMKELLQHPRLDRILDQVADFRTYDEISGDDRPEYTAVLAELRKMANTVTEKVFYRASGSTLPQTRLHQGPNKLLELQGVYIDHIVSLGSAFPAVRSQISVSATDEELLPIAAALLNWITALRTFHQEQTRDLGHLLNHFQDQFCQTILGNVSYPFHDFMRSSTPIRPAPADKLNDTWLYQLWLLKWISSGSIPDPISFPRFTKERFDDIHSHISTVCAGRAFGITSTGKMGLFPAGSKVADEVCIFLGADVPFVLRSAGYVMVDTEPNFESQGGNESGLIINAEQIRTSKPAHRLVGPAYLHNFMDGEGLSDEFRRKSFMLK